MCLYWTVLMLPRDLPRVLESFAPPIPVGYENLSDWFDTKYPKIEYQGRSVYLFTSQREFGGNRHAVSVHGPHAPAVPEHIYSYPLITYCYSGSFPLFVAGQPVGLEQGQCFVSDRHVPHSVGPTADDTCAINIVLADQFFGNRFTELAARVSSPFVMELSNFGATHDGWRCYDTADDEFVRSCIERIACESFDGDALSGYVCDNLILVLLTHLFRMFEKPQVPTEAQVGRQALMGEVRTFIANNYVRGSLSDMARELGYDRSYLSTFVRRTCGLTFKQLVNLERMRHAALLLRGTTMPVYEVAQSVGIVNLTAFYNRFKEHAGCTPQAYRDLDPEV